MSLPYGTTLFEALQRALAGGVTEGGSAYTWTYDLVPPRYGRKWMTSRARRWRDRRAFRFEPTVTIEQVDPA